MKYVYTYGAFDLLHPGHIRFLTTARALGDFLFVGVVDDESISRLKGEGRPIQSQKDRMEIVGALKGIYAVYAQTGYCPISMMKGINAALSIHQNLSVLCKGDDWNIIPGREWAEDNGMEYVSIPYSDEFSTSSVIEKIQENSHGGCDDGWQPYDVLPKGSIENP